MIRETLFFWSNMIYILQYISQQTTVATDSLGWLSFYENINISVFYENLNYLYNRHHLGMPICANLEGYAVLGGSLFKELI